MLKIEDESILLTKKLEICSEVCSKSMNKFKDLGADNNRKKAIVLITNNPQIIKDSLMKSLNNYGFRLNYRIVTVDEYEIKNFDITNDIQLFITMRSFVSLANLKCPNNEFVVIDLMNKRNLKYIAFYIDLIIKNINKYNKFNITNILQEEV